MRGGKKALGWGGGGGGEEEGRISDEEGGEDGVPGGEGGSFGARNNSGFVDRIFSLSEGGRTDST